MVRHPFRLLRLARKNRCSGIQTEMVTEFCDPAQSRWVIKAIVYKTSRSKGFVGYGDADPGNVSALVRGAEMRVAETRAVNRALRKAYGIGLCSVDEIGNNPERRFPGAIALPCPRNGSNGDENDAGNGQPRLRDRLCLLIRQHNLDATQVKPLRRRLLPSWFPPFSQPRADRTVYPTPHRTGRPRPRQTRQHLEAYADNPAQSPEAA